ALLCAGDLAEGALVLLDVLRQGAAELLGVQGGRQQADQDPHVGATGDDTAEIEHELGAVVHDAAEVDVRPLGHGIVDPGAQLDLLRWLVLHDAGLLPRALRLPAPARSRGAIHSTGSPRTAQRAPDPFDRPPGQPYNLGARFLRTSDIEGGRLD